MNTRTKKIVMAALMAALTCVATMIIKIPSPLKGYINLGDCIVLVSGWILSPAYGFLAAGLGSASDRDYTEAASVAAYYSQATGDLVAVDYTRVKNIRKPAGSKPGFVTYKTNYTAYVRPSLGKEIANG